MPELPEVQTTTDFIKRKTLGRVFLFTDTDWEKMVVSPGGFTRLKKEIKNKKIKDVYRKGKNIIFTLSEDRKLLIHQMMTGHLLYGKWEKEHPWKPKIDGPIKNDKFNNYIHFIFFLDNGYQIALSDLRKFAKIRLNKSKKIEKHLSSLGPDALEVSLDNFKKIISQKNSPIKKNLLDQHLISGIGNIYVDEILFRAKVNPKRKPKNISKKKKELIWKKMNKVLKEAIKCRGTSISDYRKPDGTKGTFQDQLKAYRQEKCQRCNGKIKRIEINNRGTYYCPKCQK